jgi:hypothetical protein
LLVATKLSDLYLRGIGTNNQTYQFHPVPLLLASMWTQTGE